MSDHIRFIESNETKKKKTAVACDAAKSKLTISNWREKIKELRANVAKMKYTDDVEAKWITARALMGNAFKTTQEFCHDIHWSDNIAHENITPFHFFFHQFLCLNEASNVYASSAQFSVLCKILLLVQLKFCFLFLRPHDVNKTSLWHSQRINHWNLRNRMKKTSGVHSNKWMPLNWTRYCCFRHRCRCRRRRRRRCCFFRFDFNLHHYIEMEFVILR